MAQTGWVGFLISPQAMILHHGTKPYIRLRAEHGDCLKILSLPKKVEL